MPIKAVLCKNCPWRRNALKAGEIGGSVPVSQSREHMRQVAHDITEGLRVMQCHKSSDRKPRPCAGFLSVVGYDSIGVRLGVAMGQLDHSDVGKPITGLYSSLAEMLREADHIDLGAACPGSD